MNANEFDRRRQQFDMPVSIASVLLLLLPIKLFATSSRLSVALTLTAVVLLVVIDRKVAAIELEWRNHADKVEKLPQMRVISLLLRLIASVSMGAFSAYIILAVLKLV